MTVPSAVVFDLGKVLVDFDYGIASRKFAARAKITPEQIRKELDHSPLLFRFETGLMTKQEFYQEVCAQTGYHGDFEEFVGVFSDIFWEIEPMIRWQATLRAQKIPTYIFSNTNELAIAHIRERFPFFGNFDGYILSYEVGAMKPNNKIYEALEEMSGRRGAEILYLDDREENVAAGAARGWRAVLHSEPEQTLPKAKQMGLPL